MQPDIQLPPLFDRRFPSIRIHHERRVNQVAVLLEQPRHAVRVAGLLVGGKRGDDVVLRHDAFLLQTDEVGEHRGGLPLHVNGAAPVEPALPLGELKWIERPVLAPGFDHVKMSDEQDSSAHTSTAQTHDDVRLLRMSRRGQQIHVSGQESGSERPRGHRLRRARRAMRLRRVDRHEFAEDVATEGLNLLWRSRYRWRLSVRAD